MHEQETIQASMLHAFPSGEQFNGVEMSRDVAEINKAVHQFLEANHINPEDVLFAGFDNTSSKAEGSEHWENGDLPYFFFGNIHSLQPPDSFTNDPDDQGEHWAVNPIKYALKSGTLGVFDKKTLQSAGELESDSEDIQDYGTYVFRVDPLYVEKAKIATLHSRK
jgi:hypothetical protein